MLLYSQIQSQTHTFTYTLKTYGLSDLCCNNPINSWPHISIYIFHCTGSHTYFKSYIVQVVTHINLYLSQYRQPHILCYTFHCTGSHTYQFISFIIQVATHILNLSFYRQPHISFYIFHRIGSHTYRNLYLSSYRQPYTYHFTPFIVQVPTYII